MTEPQPIISAAAAERWAVETLREMADALTALPRKKKPHAITRLTPLIAEMARLAPQPGMRLTPPAQPSGSRTDTDA